MHNAWLQSSLLNIAVQINLSTHIPFRPHSKSETTILKLNLVPVPKLSALLEQERPDNVRKLHLFARSTIKINIKRRTSFCSPTRVSLKANVRRDKPRDH